MKLNLTKREREFFRKTGAIGGAIGGKRCLETMTREERVARAKKAVRARKTHPIRPENR
jgi:hypothetical protein